MPNSPITYPAELPEHARPMYARVHARLFAEPVELEQRRRARARRRRALGRALEVAALLALGAVVASSLCGCCDDVVLAPDFDDDDETAGEAMLPPCVGLDPRWPGDAPLACEAIDCWMEGGPDERMHCAAAWALAEGHAGDFALGAPGDLDWNEWPYNAEAGPWEDAEYVGGAEPSCGVVSINTAMVQPDAEGERAVSLICEDRTAGVFTTHRVVLTDEGPIPD